MRKFSEDITKFLKLKVEKRAEEHGKIFKVENLRNVPLFGLESSRLLSPDLGSNGPFLKGLKFKNRFFVQPPPAPVEAGPAIGNFAFFCGGLSQLYGEAPGSFRTGAGAHCVAPVVATNWCEGPHGSVTEWRILSGIMCVFLFSIAESYLVDPIIICLSQRLIRACLSSHCSTVKQPMAH